MCMSIELHTVNASFQKREADEEKDLLARLKGNSVRARKAEGHRICSRINKASRPADAALQACAWAEYPFRGASRKKLRRCFGSKLQGDIRLTAAMCPQISA